MKIKRFKRIFFLSLILCIMSITYFTFFSARVQVEIYNKNDFDIDSLKIENKYYEIKKLKSIVINCRKLTMQDNLPFGTPEGLIKNMQRDTITFPICGTGIEEIRSGNYKFDIEADIGKDYYKLNWVAHTK